jgi:hypothetical protein
MSGADSNAPYVNPIPISRAVCLTWTTIRSGWLMLKNGNAFQTIAERMLANEGIGVIWRFHLRASVSYQLGNWLAATALVGIADTAAERLRRCEM